MKTLDIVIPVYNEEQVLPLLFSALNSTFTKERLAKADIEKISYIFVDDGSRDKSATMIKAFLDEGRNGQLIRFTRNFGHQNAVSAGIDNSTSSLIGLIDADLQDPPEIMLEMIKEIARGVDVVYGIRRRRKEHPLKVFCYWLYYRILAYLSDLNIAIDSGDFFVMTREVAIAIRSLPEKIRYPRGLKSWVGFNQIGYEYERYKRAAGKTKYPFRRLYDLATNGVTSLSIKPLRITQFFSFVFSILSIVLTCYILFLMATNSRDGNFYFYLTYLLISFTGAMLMICLYVMSAYIGRTYIEVKGRPTYIAMERLEWDDEIE